MRRFRSILASRGGLALLSLPLVALVACGGGAPAVEEEMGAMDDGKMSDWVDRSLPNPTGEVILNWAPLPDGRVWGSTAGIDIGPDGHVWAYDRCGGGLDGGCESNPELDPIFKFDSEGNFIKEWGEIGFRPGQFRTPHGLEFDSQGRLYVADRGNDRIQIFDQDGNLLDTYMQYSKVSGLFITADDTLYAIDSDSGPNNHPAWKNGVRIGPAGEDRLTGFVPSHPHDDRVQGVAGEGVAVDEDGNIYAAEGPDSRPTAGGGITKYVAN